MSPPFVRRGGGSAARSILLPLAGVRCDMRPASAGSGCSGTLFLDSSVRMTFSLSNPSPMAGGAAASMCSAHPAVSRGRPRATVPFMKAGAVFGSIPAGRLIHVVRVRFA